VSPANAGLATLSTRAMISAATPRFTTRMVVSGAESQTMLVRAVGPTLGLLGVGDALADPVVRIISADGTEIATNSDWRTGPNAAALPALVAAIGAFPLSDAARDAALRVSLAPGAYSIEVSSESGGLGTVLAEIYAANPVSALSYAAVENTVGSGESIVGGLTITGTASRRVLVRSVGPSLTTATAAADTTLAVYSGTRLLASNDDWGHAANASEIASGAAISGALTLAVGSKDAAVVVTLSPGSYSFQAGASGETGGSILVEVIPLP
jgi:hypothetical protein